MLSERVFERFFEKKRVQKSAKDRLFVDRKSRGRIFQLRKSEFKDKKIYPTDAYKFSLYYIVEVV